jgi:hypothetical protein
MEDEAIALDGARHPHYIRRWLASRDRAWELVDSMRTELNLRWDEDQKEGKDYRRFDGQPDPMRVFEEDERAREKD